MRDDIYTPPGGPPQGAPPSRQIYQAMGEENIFRLLQDFYLELEKSSIRELFPKDMVKASKKSGAFFVQLLGGPALYSSQFGHPRMRMRHLPFRIDEKARTTWLHCFFKVLENHSDYALPAEHLPAFREFLERFSAWMVNTR